MTAPVPQDRGHDRALAALQGLAIGDALGMPSQTLDRAAIRAGYGRITSFVDPVPGHPVSYGLVAGQVTDDTEQTLLLAQRLIADRGGFDVAGWAADLIGWEDSVAARGLRDLLGPSTKAALMALRAGASEAEAGRGGTTNGAAMRITPVGIATPPDPARMLVRVAQVSRLTHGTGEALAGAVAVAMVISQGLEGASFDEALPLALAAAELPNTGTDPAAHRAMADRIRAALELAGQGDEGQGEVDLADRIGTSVQSLQSVACAFGVVRLARGNPWAAAQIAANIGDDTDTIGAIACAMAAACAGTASLPAEQVEKVERINQLDLAPLVSGLIALRRAAR
ncbi:ADP-ribosylglycohydrolase family protein [Tabrizicola piscis]|nr:ADP-ribosylglycohydrolase family protein [Tabrizicola piscis]